MPAAERVIEISTHGACLHSRNRQLVVQDKDVTLGVAPLAEIASVVLAHPGSSITRGALEGLMRHGGTLIVCGDDHLPVGMAVPLSAHFEHTKRLRAQVALRKPVAKRLWATIVRTKLLAQAATLRSLGRPDARLGVLAEQVRSGDPDNREAIGAAWYWPRLFGSSDFLRRPEHSDQNRLLNYGYAIVRAAVARAVCGSGLHPSLGLHHTGRNNPFCLADDLMEPYRALVDHEVAMIVGETGPETPLDPSVKRRLVSILHSRVGHAGEYRSVTDWIAKTANSMANVTMDLKSDMFFPDGLIDDSPISQE